MKKTLILFLFITCQLLCFGSNEYVLKPYTGYYIQARIEGKGYYPVLLDFIADSAFFDNNLFKEMTKLDCLNYITQKYIVVPECIFSSQYILKQLYGIVDPSDVLTFQTKINREICRDNKNTKWKLKDGLVLYCDYIRVYGIMYIPNNVEELYMFENSNSISYKKYPGIKLGIPLSIEEFFQQK